MIERCYFMAVEKRDKRTDSVEIRSWTCHKKSLLPAPSEIYSEMFLFLQSLLKDCPGDDVRVTAFNRI